MNINPVKVTRDVADLKVSEEPPINDKENRFVGNISKRADSNNGKRKIVTGSGVIIPKVMRQKRYTRARRPDSGEKTPLEDQKNRI